MQLKKLKQQFAEWENSKNPPKWRLLVNFLKKLKFDVDETTGRGTRNTISHPFLVDSPADFSGIGQYTIDKPHSKGEPVDKGAFKNKVVPSVRLVIERYEESPQEWDCDDEREDSEAID
ncbi:MAG: hypothetical protein IPG71_09340 [bacterium]|nr:hypothetical protein [bacterium]